MHQLIDYQGQTRSIDCLGCARERGEIGRGCIVKTEFFDAHQDFEVPIPGFVIISSRRHMKSIDEFSPQEQSDFMRLLVAMRSTMRKALEIQTVYVIQEEDTSHHFHMWLFPRYPWMEDKFGHKIQSVRPIMEYARQHLKTSEHLTAIATAVEKLKISYENCYLR